MAALTIQYLYFTQNISRVSEYVFLVVLILCSLIWLRVKPIVLPRFITFSNPPSTLLYAYCLPCLRNAALNNFCFTVPFSTLDGMILCLLFGKMHNSEMGSVVPVLSKPSCGTDIEPDYRVW